MLYLNVASDFESNSSHFNSTELKLNSIESGFIIFGLTLISFITTAANICVFIAYFRNQNLQTPSSWLLLSLAVADTWVGAVSINFFTVYLVYEYWPMDRLVCNFWLSTDYWCSHASVINLLVISVDRYLMVRTPYTYRFMRNGVRLKYAIFFAWFVSFILSVPWIISYPYIVGKQEVPNNMCYIQFLKQSVFMTIFTALSAYYIPLLIMFVMYFRIFTFLRKRKQTANNLKCPNVLNESVASPSGHVSVLQKNISSVENDKKFCLTFQALPKIKYKNHNKAKKLLILIILAFSITWLPYHVFAVIFPFCKKCVTVSLWKFGYLFCYVNSLINPFCYAFGNRKFAKGIKSLFLNKK
ncbi:muscarinic acetylcholine receptor M3 isoform X2 [Hydra vulgaris]|uniref:Muscarinic acetylcholine receptor M3 isoform X2 n=1 Tax=Hydra vulgaris TaxID=6087 RepID=A0ABM4CK96_HYDVU